MRKLVGFFLPSQRGNFPNKLNNRSLEYSKQPISLEQQVQKLMSKGLLVPDHEKAIHSLSSIGYYRLKPYLLAFEHPAHRGERLVPNTHLEQILELYTFDRELRLLIFGAIERIEVALRSAFNNQLCLEYGSAWYSSRQHFKNHGIFHRMLSDWEREIERSKERFILHYKQKYTYPLLPPSWMAIEVASFGRLSNCFKNLKPTRPVKNIARAFKLKKPRVLASWIHLITIVRNICAHHGRLWNRMFTQIPAIPRNPLGQWPESPLFQGQTKLYAAIVCILYLLRALTSNPEFHPQILDLFQKYTTINISRMGFPPRWNQDPFWKLADAQA